MPYRRDDSCATKCRGDELVCFRHCNAGEIPIPGCEDDCISNYNSCIAHCRQTGCIDSHGQTHPVGTELTNDCEGDLRGSIFKTCQADGQWRNHFDCYCRKTKLFPATEWKQEISVACPNAAGQTAVASCEINGWDVRTPCPPNLIYNKDRKADVRCTKWGRGNGMTLIADMFKNFERFLYEQLIDPDSPIYRSEAFKFAFGGGKDRALKCFNDIANVFQNFRPIQIVNCGQRWSVESGTYLTIGIYMDSILMSPSTNYKPGDDLTYTGALAHELSHLFCDTQDKNPQGQTIYYPTVPANVWFEANRPEYGDPYRIFTELSMVQMKFVPTHTIVFRQPGKAALEGRNSNRGCDFFGDDIKDYPGTSSDCASRCEQEPLCTHWSWNNFNSGTCWLKEGDVIRDDAFLADQNTFCGIGSRSSSFIGPTQCEKWGWTYYDYFDLPGHDISHSPATIRADCQTLCEAVPGCNAWSWSQSQNMCYFKGNVNSDTPRTSNGDIYTAILCGFNDCDKSGIVYVDNHDMPVGDDVKDIGNGHSNTHGDCVQMCKNRGDCTGYTFNKNDLMCYLKKFNAAFPPTAPNAIANSGYVCRGTPLTNVVRVDNPFADAHGYVNPEYTSQVENSIGRDGSIAGVANDVKNQPTGIWIDNIAHLDKIGVHLRNAARQSSPQNPVYIQFLVYNLPGRDCHALASNGELSTGELNRYKSEVTQHFINH
ncbi:hypothetical protein HDV02_001366 [Globomyces sp. JEL0801]|nr:hypothetical protein HDV02_001366 [Globomyces sp. JEL0801]